MANQDYYDILGVKKDASGDELKRAYRKQAMKYHPDRNPDDKVAEKKFKEVGEAYEVLKDPQKRAAYDRFGTAAFDGSMGGGAGGFGDFGGGGFTTEHFTDLFEELFGGGGGRSRRAGPARGADLRYNLTVDFDDAYKGKTVQVKIPTAVACDACNGSGAKKGTSAKTCPTCKGMGEVRVSQGFFAMARTCPECHGRGKIIPDPCPKCHGEGRVEQSKTISVNIPAGVDTGTRIRLAGEGEAGPSGGPAGDLYIFIQVRPHAFFHREGRDIALEIPVAFVDATLGGSLEVPTPGGGKARLKIPEGTQPGQQFRLKGKGMPDVHGGSHGDLFVQAMVEVPTHLSRRQKELLEEFRNEAGHHTNSPGVESFFKKAKRFWGAAE